MKKLLKISKLCSIWKIILFIPVLGSKTYLITIGGQIIADIVKHLVNYDIDSFKTNIFEAVYIYLLVTFLDTIANYYTRIISIYWRKEITHKVHNNYCDERIFYNLNDLDNPDQRIANNIKELTEQLAQLCNSLIIIPFEIILYTYLIWKTLNNFMPIIVIYVFFSIGILSQKLILNKISEIFNYQKKLEGDFRSSHLKLIIFSTNIIEENMIDQRYFDLQGNLENVSNNNYTLSNYLFILDLFSKFIDYSGAILNYLIIAFCLVINNEIHKKKNPGDMAKLISQSSFYILSLISTFSKIINTFDKITFVYGLLERVNELIIKLEL